MHTFTQIVWRCFLVLLFLWFGRARFCLVDAHIIKCCWRIVDVMVAVRGSAHAREVCARFSDALELCFFLAAAGFTVRFECVRILRKHVALAQFPRSDDFRSVAI